MTDKTPTNPDLMEKLISLCKRRGFVYQGSEIYGGLAGTWDYGPLGVALKNNIKDSWRKKFVSSRDDMYEVDAALLMNAKVWETSGHVGGFSDPMVECRNCKKRFRVDQIVDSIDYQKQIENLEKDLSGHVIFQKGKISILNEMKRFLGVGAQDYLNLKKISCQNCNSVDWDIPKQFNMMFKTQIGAMEDSAATIYFRPETAQGMFVNFKNILDSFSPKLPFGMAQIGKAFRNEITPRDFIFRVREFEQMEIEYFVDPRNPEKVQEIFDMLYEEQQDFLREIGVDTSRLHKIEVPESDRAHYSSRSIDTEFDFPFGQKELLGLAYRTDFDLSAHAKASGAELTVFDDETKDRFIPHCIEPTFGVERLLLALLTSAYREDEQNGEVRSYLSFKPSIAPILCAVSPLLKNKPELQEKAREVFSMLKREFGRVMYDDNGNIGKRYRRQDEIGTPWCVVADFETLGAEAGKEDLAGTVTIRDRDTGTQERIAITELVSWMRAKIS